MLTDYGARSLPRPSFRDPAGFVISHRDRILRFLTAEGESEFSGFQSTATAQRLVEQGSLVSSRRLSLAETSGVLAEFEWAPGFEPAAVIEHERIPFPSFPYEWPAEMLYAAATLTLELATAVQDEGYWLKDATPYNVLFRGPEPVFVDVLSFERRPPLDHTWRPYAQFIRTFLLVLLAAKRLGRSVHDLLIARRDGPEPQEVYGWTGPIDRLRPGFLSLVTLPVLFDKKRSQDDSSIYRARQAASEDQARFIIEALYRSLGRQLGRLEPRSRRESTWSEYLDHKSLYSSGQLSEKEIFVRETLDQFQPGAVLDVGANEGHFSFLCANHGCRVVAIDFDPVVVGTIWRRARTERLDVLPLVVDLARPTPGIGWQNAECPAFLDRARGSFDLVLMLAVLHHIVVTERAPLASVMELAADLTRDLLLIEFVGPGDPMFRRLVRGRDALYQDITRDAFEQALGPHFEIVRVRQLEGLERWLYLLRKR